MPFDLERVKGLCFDVDGTLSDTDDAYVARLNRFFKSVRFLFRDKDPVRFSRWLVMASESPLNSLNHWLDCHSLDDDAARLFNRLAQSRKGRAKRFWLMRGAMALLDSCRQNYPLSVVTARDGITTGNFLKQFELEKHFVSVVNSQTCEFTKPFPHPVLYAAQCMKLKGEECVMIGDTTVDILAGKRAGAQAIGLLCGFGTADELRKAGADLVVSDLVELKQVLFPE